MKVEEIREILKHQGIGHLVEQIEYINELQGKVLNDEMEMWEFVFEVFTLGVIVGKQVERANR